MNKDTKVITVKGNIIDDEILQMAGKIIAEGGLVAFPTETVYGIGANALNEKAISGIFEAKGRPSDNPLIIHISQKKWIDRYAFGVSEKAELLMEAFWPGPLTMVFQRKAIIPNRITGGLETVAVRMPNHPLALGLIDSAGVAVAAPSANISGKPSPTDGKHVVDDLMGKVDMIIDGGRTREGLESTVIDMTSDIPCILRPGSITKSMIEAVIGPVQYDQHLKNQKDIPKSPGMKYKHYAPQGHLVVVKGKQEEAIVGYINEQTSFHQGKGYHVGVITPRHLAEAFEADRVVDIGEMDNNQEIGSNLFHALRQMDEWEADYIFAIEISGDELSVAIMNRLSKAAGYNLVDVDGGI